MTDPERSRAGDRSRSRANPAGDDRADPRAAGPGAARPSTPRRLIDAVVRSACGGEITRLRYLARDSLNEGYRVELSNGPPVIVRIARRPVPWFTDEEHTMARARAAGVPTPDVVGLHHVEHDGELLSFSVLRLVPGRPLAELASELPAATLERLVVDSGELMALVHHLDADRGIRHVLQPPDERFVERVTSVAAETIGSPAAAVVERGAAALRREILTRPAPSRSLAHGDFLPKHLLIDDREMIVGVIDWELAGPASPAFDLAHWQVAAGDDFHDRSNLVRRGYARVTDPDVADGGWVPAFAIHFALDVLGWRNPASPARLRRCVDVIARHVAP